MFLTGFVVDYDGYYDDISNKLMMNRKWKMQKLVGMKIKIFPHTWKQHTYVLIYVKLFIKTGKNTRKKVRKQKSNISQVHTWYTSTSSILKRQKKNITSASEQIKNWWYVQSISSYDYRFYRYIHKKNDQYKFVHIDSIKVYTELCCVWICDTFMDSNRT